jgi:hypothetical protein
MTDENTEITATAEVPSTADGYAAALKGVIADTDRNQAYDGPPRKRVSWEKICYNEFFHYYFLSLFDKFCLI